MPHSWRFRCCIEIVHAVAFLYKAAVTIGGIVILRFKKNSQYHVVLDISLHKELLAIEVSGALAGRSLEGQKGALELLHNPVSVYLPDDDPGHYCL